MDICTTTSPSIDARSASVTTRTSDLQRESCRRKEPHPNIIWPGFIDFIERNNPRFNDPNLKRITEAVRNSYAHGGFIEWPDQRPAATWHGVTLDKTFNGKNVHEVFGYSDVMALMLLIINEGLTL